MTQSSMIILDFFCIASLVAVGVRVVLVLISGLVALRMLSCPSFYLNLLLFEFYKVPPLNQNQSNAQKNNVWLVIQIIIYEFPFWVTPSPRILFLVWPLQIKSSRSSFWADVQTVQYLIQSNPYYPSRRRKPLILMMRTMCECVWRQHIPTPFIHLSVFCCLPYPCLRIIFRWCCFDSPGKRRWRWWRWQEKPKSDYSAVNRWFDSIFLSTRQETIYIISSFSFNKFMWFFCKFPP